MNKMDERTSVTSSSGAPGAQLPSSPVTLPSSPDRGLASPTEDRAADVPDSASTKQDDDKVIIFYKAAGNAPPMKNKKFKLNRSANATVILEFLRKQLGLKPEETLVPNTPFPRLVSRVCSSFSSTVRFSRARTSLLTSCTSVFKTMASSS